MTFIKKAKIPIILFIAVSILLAVIFVQSASTDIMNNTIVINEVASSNESIFLGVNEQNYDYIELKNISEQSVKLEDYYISDDLTDLKKSKLPDIELKPGEVIVIYASGEAQEDYREEYHVNFKLSKNDNVIIITQNDDIITRIQVPELEKNLSYGLNDSMQYVYYNVMTPGEENYSVYYRSINSIKTLDAEIKNIQINEIASEGQMSIYDEDGDFPDFIELHNITGETINISGYFISDDAENPFQYQLPETNIEPDGYLLLFASGKEKENGGYIHTNFKISAGETIYLYDTDLELVDEITLPAVGENLSYGRMIEDNTKWQYFASPTPGKENDTIGTDSISDAKSIKGSSVYISEVVSANEDTTFDAEGDAEDWVELYNQSDKSISLAGWYLSDSKNEITKWAFEDGTVIEPYSYLLIFASGKNTTDSDGNLHTNFKLTKDGETIYLSDGNIIADSLSCGKMKGNISIGIASPTDNTRYYYSETTPGTENSLNFYSGISGEVFFSYQSGYYDDAITVSISSLQNNVAIYYTTDGSTPNQSSKKYTKPINITSTTPLRAISYKKNKLSSEVATATYLIGIEEHDLPVIFLTTDHNKLFNGGIYNSSLYDDRRVDANVELLEMDKSGFNENVMVAKSGNMSVFEPQKSMNIYFKEYVGESCLYYDLFPGDPDGVTTFYSFLLRTSGNDWDDLKLKDGMLHSLAATEMDLDCMSYRPAVLYINGEYWGIYNIRDNVNADYLATHHEGVDPDNVDIISFGYGLHEGSYTEYYKMMSFIRNEDLNTAENWVKVEEMIDVDNMIDTYLMHIYYGNFDTVNIKWWRERKEGAKWRWITYDLDYSLYIPYQNNLELITDPEGHGVNKYFDSTLIYKLMKSKYFRERFMERTASYWDNIFDADVILEHLDDCYQAIATEMPDQLERWDVSLSHYIDEMDYVDYYIRTRPDAFRSMFRYYFGLTQDELDELLPKQTTTYPQIKIDTSLYQ